MDERYSNCRLPLSLCSSLTASTLGQNLCHLSRLLHQRFGTLHLRPTDWHHSRPAGIRHLLGSGHHYPQFILSSRQLIAVQLNLRHDTSQDDVARTETFVHFNSILVRRPYILSTYQAPVEMGQCNIPDAQYQALGESLIYHCNFGRDHISCYRDHCLLAEGLDVDVFSLKGTTRIRNGTPNTPLATLPCPHPES